MGRRRGSKWYVVISGINPGIYTNWNEVAPLVTGVSGNHHKSFGSYYEALEYFKRYTQASPHRTKWIIHKKPQEIYNDVLIESVDSSSLAIKVLGPEEKVSKQSVIDIEHVTDSLDSDNWSQEIGRWGEELVFLSLTKRIRDLLPKAIEVEEAGDTISFLENGKCIALIQWHNRFQESNQSPDFTTIVHEERTYWEVKTTKSVSMEAIFTQAEREFGLKHHSQYRILRVTKAGSAQPCIYEIPNPFRLSGQISADPIVPPLPLADSITGLESRRTAIGYGKGKRKGWEAHATITCAPISAITVNGISGERYFPDPRHISALWIPVKEIELIETIAIEIQIEGGNTRSQIIASQRAIKQAARQYLSSSST